MSPQEYCCRVCLTVVVAACFVSFSAGQTAPLAEFPPIEPSIDYVTHTWTTEEGLPHSTVTAISQSQDGFLWLGTRGGLVRFDGVSFRLFDRETTEGLNSNRIQVLYTDRHGRLWIGTEGGGLSSYDSTGFTPFSETDGLPSGNVLSISEGPEGMLWVGTDRGLVRLENQRFAGFTAPNGPGAVAILSLHSDRQGHLWIATKGKGLARYDGSNFTWFSQANSLPSDVVLSLIEGPEETLLVGMEGAGPIRLLDGRFEPLVGPGSAVAINRVFAQVVDRKGNLWLATGRGLVRFHDGAFHLLASGREVPSDPINTLYVDRENNLWMGTDRGLMRLKENPFQILTEQDGLAAATALAIYGAREGTLWIGTQCGGLNRLQGGTLTTLSVPDGLSDSCVWSLLQDREGVLWIGTEGGLYRYDQGRFSTFTTEDGLADNLVLAIHEDLDGVLWFGTRNGLSRYSEGRFSTFTTEDGLSDNWIRSILQDGRGALWFATATGLSRRVGDTFQRFTTEEGLSSNDVRTLYEDAAGVLWIGTFDGGLNRYAQSTFTNFSTQDGLADNRVSAILEDNFGYLWMCGNRGIQRINKQALQAYAADEIERVSAHLYGRSDGLRNPECTGGFQPSAWKAEDGRLWFPTYGGAASIDPALQATSVTAPPTFIEAIVANDRILDSPAHVKLSRGLRDVEVQYTGISLRSPEHVQFRYRMEGLDDEWIEAGTRRQVFYQNMPPGAYTFHVLASTDGSTWNEAVASLNIPPYFYETGWFWTLCAFAALAFGLTLYRWNMRRLEARAEKLQRMVDERTQALVSERERTEAALAEAERQYERARQALATVEEQAVQLLRADHLKSRFFANISHEFRTPLTLVIDPLENALQGDYGPLDEPFQERIRIALRNARLVLRLINQLLDLAKLEAGSMELHTSREDLIPFLHGIVQVFESEAERLGIALLFTPAQETLTLHVDRDKLEKILFNLISNALKATPKGGKILVSVGQRAEQDPASTYAEICVRDTGIGIAPDKLPYIFDRFYQVDTPSTRHRAGTGIGLSLAKELAELHQGSIEVESVPGFGSAFTLLLPVSDPILLQQEVARPETPDLPLHPQDYVSTDFPVVRPAGLPEATAPSHSDGDVTRPLVLVVEDNADVRTMIRDHLTTSYRVAEAGDGLEGIEKAHALRPDLIISDVVMPGMEGIAFCRLLKQDKRLRDIPFILLTARASDESRMEGLVVGADDYLTKPFNKRELLTRIENLIQSRRTLREQFSKEVVLQPHGVVVPSEDAAFLERVNTAVDQHLEDPHFTVGALAAAVGLSESQLKRRMSAIAHEPPVAFIRNFRLDRAAQLLKQRAGNVGEVAFAVGFQNLPYFAKCFRERFGTPPSQYADVQREQERPEPPSR